jgi:acyl-CoA dehydrogenase
MNVTPDTLPIGAFLASGHEAFAETIGAWCNRMLVARPEPANDTAARVEARALLSTIASAGWFRPIIVPDWRGCCLAREALAAASPLADAVFALQSLSTVPIARAGDQDLNRRFTAPALAGHAIGGFAITERNAGSDVASIATCAVRDGADYVLNGEKCFISNAGIADFYVVFASTDPTAGGKGISAFVVEADTPGLTFVGPQLLSSPHPLGELAFHDCRVPAANRLGEEGKGLALAFQTLDRLRPTVGAAACGMAARALGEAIAHAKVRRQFGRPIAEFQLVQEKLARMATSLTAARMLVYHAARRADMAVPRITLEAAMAKSFATETAQRVVDDAVQILGGTGVLASHPVDRLYRSVRALRIYEGTTEIQHLVIAGQLLAQAGDEPTA